MFKSIGTILVLYTITQMMSQTFDAFEDAATASFQVLEVAANASKNRIEELQ
jgi:hypothetical protein